MSSRPRRVLYWICSKLLPLSGVSRKLISNSGLDVTSFNKGLGSSRSTDFLAFPAVNSFATKRHHQKMVVLVGQDPVDDA